MPGSPPGPFTPSWLSRTVLTKTQLDELAAYVNGLPRGYIDDARDATGTVTLATVSTDFASTASSAVTFTVSASDAQRRYEINVQARFRPNAVAHGNYSIQVAYNSGSSISLGSATKAGVKAYYDSNSNQTGDNGSGSQIAFACPLLTPGTYTAYMVVRREQGGDPGDVATGFHVIVEDFGAL